MSALYSEDSIKTVKETTPQVTSKLKERDIPTLLLWGRDEIFVSPEHGRHFNEDLKGSKLVVLEDTGHFIVEERPQQVADGRYIGLLGSVARGLR
jgi:pimeloyl-ACP methyl ester carboxylesterase